MVDSVRKVTKENDMFLCIWFLVFKERFLMRLNIVCKLILFTDFFLLILQNVLHVLH